MATPTVTWVNGSADWDTNTGLTRTVTYSGTAGDRLLLLVGSENGTPSFAATPVTNDGAALTWTQQEVYDNGANEAMLGLWSTTLDTTRSIVVTITLTGTVSSWGAGMFAASGSSGFGASEVASIGVGSGAPTLPITATGANSAIVGLNLDWNATTGARTYNTATAGTATEDRYDGTAGSNYIVNVFRYADAGTAGAKTVGITSPATQRYVIAAVEILGTSAIVNGYLLMENSDRILSESGSDLLVSEDFVAAGGGVDNPLAGAVAGSSASSGSAAARLALVGAVAAVTVASGAIGVSQGLSGTVAATSAAAGTTASSLTLAGSTTGSSSTSGAPTALHPLGGTTAATTGTTGTPLADHPLVGSAAGTTAFTGSLVSTQALAGIVAGTSATTGNPTLRAPLVGTVAGTSGTSGTPTSRQGLTGVTAASSSASGTFFEAGPQTYPLTGTSAATTVTTGAITGRRALAGQTAAVTGTSGSTTAQHPLTGSIAASTDTAGTVTLCVTLDGSTPVLSAVMGAVTVTLPLSGAVTAVTSTAGSFGDLVVLDLTIKDTLPPLAVRQPRPPLAVTDARPPLSVRGPLPALTVVDTRPALTVRNAP